MDIKAPAPITGQNAFRLPGSGEKGRCDMARAVFTIAVTALMLANAGRTASDEASWMPALRHVLAHEQKCKLSEVLWTREVPVGTAKALEGRARCLDGREFDFMQRRPHMKLDVRLCQPTIC